MFDDNNLYGVAKGLNERGRHANVRSALECALADLMTERSPFYDSLVDNWRRLFPELPACPGRLEGDTVYLYVTKAATSFMIRPKLPAIKRRLAELPGAPARFNLRVEIHMR